MKRSNIALLAVLTLFSCCPMTVGTATAAITFEAIPEDSPCAWSDCLKEHRKCIDAAPSDKIHFCNLALENCKEQCAAPIRSLITQDATDDAGHLVEVPVAFGVRAFNPENFVFGEGINSTVIKLTDNWRGIRQSLRSEVLDMFTPNKASRLFSALLSPQELATLLGPEYFTAPTTNGRSLVAHRGRLVEVAPNRRNSTGSMIWVRGGKPVASAQSVEEILRLIQGSQPVPGPEFGVMDLEMQLKRSTIQGTVSTIFHWLADFGIIQVSNDGIDGIVELIISILQRFGVEVSAETISESVRELVATTTARSGC